MSGGSQHTGIQADGDEVLRAGDLQLRLVGSDVRSVTWNGTEVLQRAYYAVRDAPWNTVPAVLGEVSVTRRADDFSALIRQRHQFADIDLDCELALSGSADGTLVITAVTEARSSFSYSKIGLNLHHGMRTYRRATGRAQTLDGWVPVHFADEIQPQLISGATLTAMFAHFDALEVDLPGASVSFTFGGDRFEMQDHRNWCDANWKTYGTPLEYGFPMDCVAGQRFEQTVTVSIANAPGDSVVGRSPTSPTADLDVTLGLVDGRLPILGVDATTALLGESLAAIDPAFVRVVFGPASPAALSDGTREQLVAAGTPVEAVVHVDSDDLESVRRHVDDLAASGLSVQRIVCMAGGGAFSAFRGATPVELVGAWCSAMADSRLADVPVFSGTDQSYNVIARDRPEYPAGVGIMFAPNAQVHACDDESIIQNSSAFADVARDCRRLYPDRAIAMSPVHLISENGPFPGGPPRSPADRPQDDPRYGTSFAAAWSVAMLATVAGERLDAICLFDLAGPRGVTDADGRVKPVGSLLATLAGRSGEPTRSAATSSPDEIGVLDVGEGSQRTVLVANLTPTPRLVTISGWGDGEHRLELEPFAVAPLR